MTFSEYNELLSEIIEIVDTKKFSGKKFDQIYDLNLNIKELFYQIEDNGTEKLGEENKQKILKILKPFIAENTSKLFQLNTKKNPYNDFLYKNILFKGVPGTGKSHTIDQIIEHKLKLEKGSPEYENNVLKINIHSASSNADLMQGIAISTQENNVVYKEKSGLIFEHVRKACFAPYQPFVLILEEIQENSLNELIGDLIYLIEPSKRTKISQIAPEKFKKEEYDYQELINAVYKDVAGSHYVKIPNLVNEGEVRRIIMPDNLYIFCTSNYRDDKKVIEDNLLRRFHVIEVYPKYRKDIGADFHLKEASDFLENLNDEILKTFSNIEIHPDRFMIGHANWLNIGKKKGTIEKDFYEALLKVVIEFKEIKELSYEEGLGKIFSGLKIKMGDDQENMINKAFKTLFDKEEEKSIGYKRLVSKLQEEIYSDLFDLSDTAKAESEEQSGHE